ncbi:HelD family protein [Nocardioides marmoribigeumensis]|uniref:DNA helicase IV n=1 Tax=Nocardioides marmoribigeumensis TaxID=433649 RepID=A0ABU2BY87_9ACTN|nr:UvrD-helicase domain-containing protein [Nocardioides marmoribigeumensis]MDR7363367.1 DNA helicase IV [Nocardioides marmoribigeumensis]
MTATADEIKLEQDYFDRAWEAREDTRRTLSSAHEAAAGGRAAASAVNKGAKERLAKLADPDEPVAIGRFDQEDETWYVGRHAISDDESNLLVINWQAPAAAPYFQASVDDPCGVLRRRKFETDRNRVVSFEEAIFAELAAAVGGLTEAQREGIDDSVLRDLQQDRTGEMRDIVQTIHEAQYELIRSELGQLLVIQGGPGTGKTAVALHRVSWLLFNHLGTLSPEDVLVVGPNPTFTRYIRNVLPGLGDADVQHQDVRSLGPQSSTGRAEDVDVARLKGAARMAGLLAVALRQRVRFPAGSESFDVGSGRQRATITRSQVEPQLRRFLQSPGGYNSGRTAFRGWLNAQTGDQLSPSQLDAAAERIWPSLTAQQFLRDLFGSRERLVGAAGDEFTAGDVNRLLRSAAQRAADEQWSDADVALLDEADHLISGTSRRFRHIVVDEAQDLSPMQLRSLRRRSVSGSMTVVGDIAQSTGPWARDSWDEVIGALRQDLPVAKRDLHLGYRVPQQVFELAARLLPLAAPGVVAPRVVRRGPADPRLVAADEDNRHELVIKEAQEFASRGLFVGIVCPLSLRDDLVTELTDRDVVWSDAAKGNLSKSINVVSPEEAKGLEFDAVIVVEPEEIVAESPSGFRLLYVALTRTTRYLSVVHVGAALPLTAAAAAVAPSLAPPLTEGSGDQDGLFEVVAEAVEPSEGAETLLATRFKTPTEDTATTESTNASSGTASASPRGTNGLSLREPGAGDPGDALARVVSESVAASLAQSVRQSVAPPLWPYVIDRLRRELGVSDAEVFDLFGD